MDDPLDAATHKITALLEDLCEISAVYHQRQRLVFSLSFRYQQKKGLRLLRDRLNLSGYDFTLDDREEVILLMIDPVCKFRIPRLNIILFLATLASVYFVPVFLRNGASLEATLEALGRGEGLEFTAAMMSILLVHEMGHFLAGRRRGIVTSWPYFIPAPSFIGTFGAIIKSKSPFATRRDLIEVGAAGPIAGWLVAVCWLAWGIPRSTWIPEAAISADVVFFGDPLAVKAIVAMLAEEREGFACMLSEAAFAGWVGMLVTAINLLPMGQLDGGHIVYGLMPRIQKRTGYFTMAGLIALGFQSPVWWFFAAFGVIFGVKHPPTVHDMVEPSRAAKIIGVAALVIFLLSFTPVPFQ